MFGRLKSVLNKAVKSLASKALELLRWWGVEPSGGSVWVDLAEGPDYLELGVQWTPLTGFSVTATRTWTAITVEVAVPAGLDPVEDVELLVYDPVAYGYCLGIAPPGYYYVGIDYITASSWDVRGSTAVITVDPAELEDAMTRAGCSPNSYLVVVLWHGVNDYPVYAAPAEELLGG